MLACTSTNSWSVHVGRHQDNARTIQHTCTRAPCSLHPQVVVGRMGDQLLTDNANNVTSHLQGLFYRTTMLMQEGIKPVYVLLFLPHTVGCP